MNKSIISDKLINLDFIYGNLDGDTFLPLDGQQRLTTLFLLHWYAYEKENTGDKADKWYLRQNPKALSLPFKENMRRPDRDNAIDVYPHNLRKAV